MRLLADENLHGKVVACLRGLGYQLDWIKELARGAKDADLLALPGVRDYILITNDRDFGELIFRYGLPPPLAILYTRLEHRDWSQTTERLIAELESGIAERQITTITKGGARRRAFPTGVSNG